MNSRSWVRSRDRRIAWCVAAPLFTLIGCIDWRRSLLYDAFSSTSIATQKPGRLRWPTILICAARAASLACNESESRDQPFVWTLHWQVPINGLPPVGSVTSNICPLASVKSRGGKLCKRRGERSHPSYYHPDFLGRIEELETTTINNGTLLYEDYPVRYFWFEFGWTIGASRGEETKFVLVECHVTGQFHGHPVTWKELDKKRRDLEDH